MVGAHVTDAWTRLDDRSRTLYMYVVFIAGMAAPLFLFLAGLTIAMAASARAVKVGHAAAAALARKRGLQIFALAFLFRLQSQLLGWGAFTNFLKVDILNVMGIAMIAAAVLWSLSATRPVRIALFRVGDDRRGDGDAARPRGIDPCRFARRHRGVHPAAAGPHELRAVSVGGFRLRGGIAGELCSRHRANRGASPPGGPLDHRLAGIALAYAASFRPSIYPVANFWTSSPTFFFIRSAFARRWCRSRSASITFTRSCAGASRLAPAHRRARPGRHDPWPIIAVRLLDSRRDGVRRHRQAAEARPAARVVAAATVALCALLYAIVKWKDRKMAGRELTWRLENLRAGAEIEANN
jgi:hypothetical protein